MTEKEIYTKLGQYILDSINENWENAILYIEFVNGIKKYNTEYFINKESKWLENDAYRIHSVIDELIKYTKQNNYAPWNRATFKLSSDFKFDINYEWDDKLEKGGLFG